MNYFFLFTYFGGILFLIKRNMNNIAHKNAFINTNDLYINCFYNHVLAKIIIFVINSILSICVLPVALIPEMAIKT